MPGVPKPPVPRIGENVVDPIGLTAAESAAAVGGVGALTVGVMVAVAVCPRPSDT